MKQSVDPSNVKPCRHMEGLVSAWVDGALTGLSRLYTEFHVRTCPQCTASLPFLRLLKGRLAGLPNAEPEKTEVPAPALPAERWENVNDEWDRTDREIPAG